MKSIDEVRNALKDLGDCGIHLDNKPGVCYKCGNETDRNYLGGRCTKCRLSEGFYDPSYNSQTIFVRKQLYGKRVGNHYMAAVKIDGTVLVIPDPGLDCGELYDLRTGKPLNKQLGIPRSEMEQIYEQAQAEFVTPVYLIQLYWPQICGELEMEAMTRAPWLNYIPFSRFSDEKGWAKLQPYIRLYVMHERGLPKSDFHLVDVQVVYDPKEAFLEGYGVVPFPVRLAILKWSQIKERIVEAFVGFEGKDFKHAYYLTTKQLETRNGKGRIVWRETELAEDWWITFFFSKEESKDKTMRGVRSLEKVVILPMSTTN